MYYFLKKYFLIKKHKLHNIFKLINKDDIIFDIGAHSGEKSKNLLKGYSSQRKLSMKEKKSINILCKGAALKYLTYLNSYQCSESKQ